MKKLFFLLLPFVLFACGKGVEQYRGAIEGLGSEWDATTSAITEFANNLNTDLSNFSQMAGAMNLSEDVQKKLKPEQATEWQTVRAAFSQALQAFAPIRTQVGEFTKTWGEKAAEVQALKDGLASGKLEGDVNANVEAIKTHITLGKESLEAWKKAHNDAKAQAQSAADNMKAVYDKLNAAPAK